MKKLLTCISVAMCALVAVCFSACTTTKWITPEFSTNKQDITIELTTNRENDFQLPIEGQKLDHAKFAEEKLLEFCWIIYDSDRKIVGWIEGGGYDSNQKGDYTIGFSTSYQNEVYGFWGVSFTVVLKSTDLTIFDGITVTSSCGTVTKGDSVKGTDRYNYYDEAENVTKVCAGAEKFVTCNYGLDFEEMDVKDVTDPSIVITLPAE